MRRAPRKRLARLPPGVAAWSERRRARMRRKRPDDCQESGTGNRGQQTSPANQRWCLLARTGWPEARPAALPGAVQPGRPGGRSPQSLRPFCEGASGPRSDPHKSAPSVRSASPIHGRSPAARHGPERTVAAARDRLGGPFPLIRLIVRGALSAGEPSCLRSSGRNSACGAAGQPPRDVPTSCLPRPLRSRLPRNPRPARWRNEARVSRVTKLGASPHVTAERRGVRRLNRIASEDRALTPTQQKDALGL